MRPRLPKVACLLAVALGSLGAGLAFATHGFARDRTPAAAPVLPLHSPAVQALPQVREPGAEPRASASEPTQAVASAVPLRPASSTPEAPVPLSLGSGASGLDPATVAAREIARRVRHFHSFRSEIPLASWRTDSAATWRVRSSTRCQDAADKLRLPSRPLDRALLTPVPTPVVVTGPVGGISYRPVQSDRELELSCELATRLPALSALLRAHGVRVAHVNSSYRDQPRVSFHTFGLALDIASFETSSGPLVVATDFELAPEVATCEAKPTTERGRAILALACALADSGLFSSVLTPNYNAGHRDHFHLDIRPDDSRLFVR